MPISEIIGFLEITESATSDDQVTGKAYCDILCGIAGPMAVTAVWIRAGTDIEFIISGTQVQRHWRRR